jgi:hypothetical protein
VFTAMQRTILDGAACVVEDPDLFFPDSEPGSQQYRAQVAEAMRICAGCDVEAECRSRAADRREIWGVWGGVDRGGVDRHQAARDPRPARATR